MDTAARHRPPRTPRAVLDGHRDGRAGSAAFLVLAVVDQRELLGAPLWFKPLKFAISFAAYLMALAWMLGRLPTPALQRTGWAIVAGVVIEMVIIAGQAARGELSHFNDDGGLGTLLFAIMGATVGRAVPVDRGDRGARSCGSARPTPTWPPRSGSGWA